MISIFKIDLKNKWPPHLAVDSLPGLHPNNQFIPLAVSVEDIPRHITVLYAHLGLALVQGFAWGIGNVVLTIKLREYLLLLSYKDGYKVTAKFYLQSNIGNIYFC